MTPGTKRKARQESATAKRSRQSRALAGTDETVEAATAEAASKPARKVVKKKLVKRGVKKAGQAAKRKPRKQFF